MTTKDDDKDGDDDAHDGDDDDDSDDDEDDVVNLDDYDLMLKPLDQEWPAARAEIKHPKCDLICNRRNTSLICVRNYKRTLIQ